MIDNQIDELDRKIIQLIANNARISFLEVARLCNVSGAAIHQRIQKMQSSGVITGSGFSIDVKRIGYETCAYVNLDFTPETNLAEVEDYIKTIPEIVECHHTTGAYDLLIKVYAHNNAHLYDLLQNQLKKIGLSRSESIISFREAFHRQIIPATEESFEIDPQLLTQMD